MTTYRLPEPPPEGAQVTDGRETWQHDGGFWYRLDESGNMIDSAIPRTWADLFAEESDEFTLVEQ